MANEEGMTESEGRTVGAANASVIGILERQIDVRDF